MALVRVRQTLHAHESLACMQDDGSLGKMDNWRECASGYTHESVVNDDVAFEWVASMENAFPESTYLEESYGRIYASAYMWAARDNDRVDVVVLVWFGVEEYEGYPLILPFVPVFIPA